MFCKYCGKSIPDGGTCDCAGAQAARSAQTGAAQTAAPQDSASQKPASDIGKQVADAFKSIPDAFKSLIKDVTGTSLKLPAAIILSAAALLFYLLGGLCMNSALWKGMQGIVLQIAMLTNPGMGGFGVPNEVTAGFSQLSGMLSGTAVGMGCLFFLLSMVYAMAIVMVFRAIRKEKVDFVAAFGTAAAITLIPSALFLVGSLLGMALPTLGILLASVASLVHTLLYAQLLWRNVRSHRSAVNVLITAVILVIFSALIGWILSSVMQGAINSLARNAMGAGMNGFFG